MFTFMTAREKDIDDERTREKERGQRESEDK